MMKEITNAGKQDSRFFITLKSDASWGDDRYSAFGRITKGMDVIRSLIFVPVEPPSNYPKTPVNIVDSGVY
jgi:cyclophilin family peptidyl-prolyl cis-trans isomerase